MSRLLRQVEHRLNIKAKPKPAEPDALDGHMAAAIKQAVQPEVEAQVREHLRDLPALVREEVQATASAQLSLQARKHAAGALDESNSRLSKLEQFQATAAPQAPLADADLDKRIRRQVADQLAKQRPAVAPQAVPDYQPPPLPQAPRPMPVIEMIRGADGRIKGAHVGRLTLLVERDSAGKAMRLIPMES